MVRLGSPSSRGRGAAAPLAAGTGAGSCAGQRRGGVRCVRLTAVCLRFVRQFPQLSIRVQLYDWSRVSDMHFRHLEKGTKGVPRNNFTVRLPLCVRVFSVCMLRCLLLPAAWTVCARVLGSCMDCVAGARAWGRS